MHEPQRKQAQPAPQQRRRPHSRKRRFLFWSALPLLAIGLLAIVETTRKQIVEKQ